LFFFLLQGAAASKLNQGFEALKMRDYFRSKKTFEFILKKKADPYASYGLAVIFFATIIPIPTWIAQQNTLTLVIIYTDQRQKPKPSPNSR